MYAGVGVQISGTKTTYCLTLLVVEGGGCPRESSKNQLVGMCSNHLVIGNHPEIALFLALFITLITSFAKG